MERRGNAARPTELAQEFLAPLNINIEAQLLSLGQACAYSTCAKLKGSLTCRHAYAIGVH